MAKDENPYVYTPEWEVDEYRDRTPQFNKAKRQTKEEILAEIAQEKKEPLPWTSEYIQSEPNKEQPANPSDSGQMDDMRISGYLTTDKTANNPQGNPMYTGGFSDNQSSVFGNPPFNQTNTQSSNQFGDPGMQFGNDTFSSSSPYTQNMQNMSDASFAKDMEQDLGQENESKPEKKKKKKKLGLFRRNEEETDDENQEMQDVNEEEADEDLNNDEEEYDFYEDEPRSIPRAVIIVPLIIAMIAGFGLFGYYNTDFDNHGNTYVIPIDIRYERQYIQKTDQLMNLFLKIDKSLSKDLKALPQGDMAITNKLTNYVTDLKRETNDVSRYVGVPTKFEPYHKDIINFSLNLQEFILNCMDKCTKDGYSDFLQNGLSDYETSFEKIKSERVEIEDEVFRNIGHPDSVDTSSSKTK